MINAQYVTHVGIEVRNRCIRILLVCFPGRVGCLCRYFVVTKTLQEVNALKEIPGRRDRGIGTLPKDPISALDFKDRSVWLTKHKKTWVNLHCD